MFVFMYYQLNNSYVWLKYCFNLLKLIFSEIKYLNLLLDLAISRNKVYL